MIKYSTGLLQFVAGVGSWRQALSNGRLMIYSGAQPTSADDAPSGVLLVTLTEAAGVFTAETNATANLQITGGGAGSIDTITLGGLPLIDSAVAWDTDASTTALAVANAINDYQNQPCCTATVSTDTVTIISPKGSGASFNGAAIGVTATTITHTTDATISGGVDSTNGLMLLAPVDGVISKTSGVLWQGDPVATGTAGYFRYVASSDDAFGSSSAALRIDGSIATSGADFNIDTSIVLGVPQAINTFSITIPSSNG